MELFFIIDVESIGLHGEGFAVAAGTYTATGAALLGSEFVYACERERAQGTEADREWVIENVPAIQPTHEWPRDVRDAFWKAWIEAKQQGAVMAAECLWPVEARFVEACWNDDPTDRQWNGPYPFMEIASYMAAAGMDPMAAYPRLASEQPAHHPLADIRLSARLLAEALAKLSHDERR